MENRPHFFFGCHPALISFFFQTIPMSNQGSGRAHWQLLQEKYIVIPFAKRTLMRRVRKELLKDVPIDELLCRLFKE
jgi:hypothetical protein